MRLFRPHLPGHRPKEGRKRPRLRRIPTKSEAVRDRLKYSKCNGQERSDSKDGYDENYSDNSVHHKLLNTVVDRSNTYYFCSLGMEKCVVCRKIR